MRITMEIEALDQVTTMEQLKDQKITQKAGAEKLGVSIRQIRRRLVKYKEIGARSFIHGNKGRPSKNVIDPERKKKILEIVGTRYADFGPTFAAEKLEEEFKESINPKTLRRYMIEANLWQNGHRKRNKHRSWRKPKEYYGQLVQLDGSKHKWIKGSNEYWTLIKFIDNATKAVLWAEFAKSESLESVMTATKNYFAHHGKPVAIYTDKGSVFKVNNNNKEKVFKTQYEVALSELGVKLIHAHSPQAKGQIERSFETDQDRLVKELYLAEIKEMKPANEFLRIDYLPKINAKFTRIPAKEGNLHRKVTKQQLEEVFCLKNERVVQNDWTILYKGRFFQIDSSHPALVKPKDICTICEHFDGKIEIKIRSNNLDFKELTQRGKMNKVKTPKGPPIHYRPSADHPWRRFGDYFKSKEDIFTWDKKRTFSL